MGLRQSWQDLRSGHPGKRFEQHYRHGRQDGRGIWFDRASLAGGIVLIVAGTFLGLVPGVPGFVFAFVGAALMAKSSLAVARTLDWIENRVRKLVGS